MIGAGSPGPEAGGESTSERTETKRRGGSQKGAAATTQHKTRQPRPPTRPAGDPGPADARPRRRCANPEGQRFELLRGSCSRRAGPLAGMPLLRYPGSESFTP